MRILSTALAITAALAMNAHPVAAQSTSRSVRDNNTQSTRRSSAMRMLHGTLEKVDTAGRTIAIKTADGAEAIVHFTDRTVVHGIPSAVQTAALAGKEGAHVLVHYTDDALVRGAREAGRAASAASGELRKAGEKTADAVVFVGRGALNVAEGTIGAVDRGAKTVAVDMANGGRDVFRFAEGCTINTAHGVERAAAASGRALQKGERAIVYYTEEGGHKVVHAIDEAAHAL